ncbi:MAG: hypothetical protein K2N39_03360, partial [Lachnospiraceae bacterium]|nr:hypothetical protein [Lachnospiraceae bacterium]
EVLKLLYNGYLRTFFCAGNERGEKQVYADSFTIHWTAFSFGCKIGRNIGYITRGREGVL